jgi:mono/diheme cytochrome c family protein
MLSMNRTRLGNLNILLACIGVVVATATTAAAPIDYRSDVLPILAENCYGCHGPDPATRKVDLRFDVRAPALTELKSGHVAIVPGAPAKSALLERIASADPNDRMPPPGAGAALSTAQIETLRRWIKEGAEYSKHWSFQVPRPPVPPAETADAWVRNAIDPFVLRKLRGLELDPSPDEDLYVLGRRVALDLTGLPPAPEALDRLVASTDPAAYERYVDHLLAKPSFGERWGRVWLDLARYADSAGYAQDPERTIWMYRDWVIDALNADMPFDQFTREQIAGDLLPDADESTLIATAFHRNTMTNSEGGTDNEEFRNAAVVDRVNTTFQVWMGLTMGCAQCHSHKYDPITQEEYFRVFAIFNSSEDADRGDEAPVLSWFTPTEKTQRLELEEQIAALKKAIDVATPANASSEKPKGTDTGLAEKQKELATLQQALGKIQGVRTPVMRELPADKRRTTRIQIRGNFLITGDEVTPGLPAAFHPYESPVPNRQTLAEWLLTEENPLTARVVVNRHWEQIFGQGLVTTSEDFGIQGERPSHPELLDMLALELIRSDWNVKGLLRLFVTSSTYRQTTAQRPEHSTLDPFNRFLSRGPRFRLSAEMIRDQALAVSGLLSDKMRGPSVRPPRPVLGLKAAFGGTTDWQTSAGADRYRRGLYTKWRRTSPHPSLMTFDAPTREFCTIRRISTNTPLQALVTLNDPVYVEAAQALARRMVAEGGDRTIGRVVRGFRLCLGRPPSATERDEIVALHARLLERYENDLEGALHLATEPLGGVDADADLVDLAAWTVVANVLMNLDEFLARR